MAHILIVDDNTDTVAALSKLLKRDKHEVITASTGAEGLLILRDRSDVDLVILDVNMPALKGTDLLTQLDNKSPPIIIMTGAYEEVRLLDLTKYPMVKHVVLKGQETVLEDLQKAIADVLGDAKE